MLLTALHVPKDLTSASAANLWYLYIAIAVGISSLVPKVRQAVYKAWQKILEKLMRPALKARDHKQDELIDLVTDIHTVLVGRKPTELDPEPSPGLVTRVASIEDTLKKQSPNGGDTNNMGDLILRMAREQGVVLDDSGMEKHSK